MSDHNLLVSRFNIPSRAEQNRPKPNKPDKLTEPILPETEPTENGSGVGFAIECLSVSGRAGLKTDISPRNPASQIVY